MARILYFDTDEIWRDQLANELRSMGHTVCCTSYAQEALRELSEDDFNLFLVGASHRCIPFLSEIRQFNSLPIVLAVGACRIDELVLHSLDAIQIAKGPNQRFIKDLTRFMPLLRTKEPA